MQRSSVLVWLEREIAAAGGQTDLQTNLPPALDIVKQGTKLEIRTAIERISEQDGKPRYKTRLYISVGGYTIEGDFDKQGFRRWTSFSLHLEGREWTILTLMIYPWLLRSRN